MDVPLIFCRDSITLSSRFPQSGHFIYRLHSTIYGAPHDVVSSPFFNITHQIWKNNDQATEIFKIILNIDYLFQPCIIIKTIKSFQEKKMPFELKKNTINEFHKTILNNYDERPFLYFVGDEPLSYKEYGEKVLNLRKRLLESGLRKGDRVAILGAASPIGVSASWLL